MRNTRMWIACLWACLAAAMATAPAGCRQKSPTAPTATGASETTTSAAATPATGTIPAGPSTRSSRYAPVADLVNLPQDCMFYVGEDFPDSADEPLVSPQTQARWREEFRHKWYAPWHRAKARTDLAEVESTFKAYIARPGVGENLRPHTSDWAESLLANAGLRREQGVSREFPNMHQRGMTARRSPLRAMPTLRPVFAGHGAGEGYPFDTLQESSVEACTPLLVVHKSLDGQWLYVECPQACGWMPAGDVVFVDDDFVRQWESAPLAPVLTDGVGAFDGGRLAYSLNCGAVLPADRPAGEYLLLTAGLGRSGCVIRRPLAGDEVSGEFLELTPRNVAAVSQRMLGQPYGWGGLYEQRDCSSTLRDLFTPFGLCLPRNSGGQARAGKFISLKDLPGPDKERRILERGVPWLTLVHAPGHIMLYIGRHDGQAIILHNTWGVVTRDSAGREGRHIIGQCCITTLQPGVELPDADPAKLLRERIDGITLLDADQSESN